MEKHKPKSEFTLLSLMLFTTNSYKTVEEVYRHYGIEGIEHLEREMHKAINNLKTAHYELHADE